MNRAPLQASRSEPTRRRGLLGAVLVVNIAFAQTVYVGLLTILPAQAALHAAHAKQTRLAVILGTGAVVALVASIGTGILADRLARRRGNRRMLLFAGAAFVALGLPSAAASDRLWLITIFWCVTQIGLNAVLTAATCALVDWFAVTQRGRASAYAAVGQVCGVLLASAISLLSSSAVLVASVSAVLLVAGCVAVAIRWETARLGPDQSRSDLSAHAATDVAQVEACALDLGTAHERVDQYRDTRLAWAVRATMTFANTIVFSYVGYYVDDELSVSWPKQFVSLGAAIASVAVLVAAVLAGVASDRSGRRRRFVNVAAVLMALGLTVFAVAPSPVPVLAACVAFGAGYGCYAAVDQALTVDTLPRVSTRGRDAGLLNTSTTVPQIAAPAFAAGVIHASGNSYGLLFGVGALITLSVCLIVARMRTVA